MKSEDLLPFIPSVGWKKGAQIQNEAKAPKNSYGAMLSTLERRGLIKSRMDPNSTPGYPKYHYQKETK